ncbi:uncharacterized protein BDZ99DRAFT_492026 [Mytilinidion resinicola]|uniref:Methyltransferase n=1 Tax=Mytilinidion resinicola TaxID=574789 RepID=A0A6A6Y2I6_9PEZI|nr:uncharacterized protein BDZ99DRAFT_492026 [Mytilinidion resinicola]KAF2802768.1 hypothetical protein BDZ99DRAFT_492026 [Mytilinidion resinicola]
MNEVTSRLNYTAPLDLYLREKPFYSNVPAPNGVQSNQKVQTYEDIVFHDIRRNIGRFNIDDQGFEVIEYAGKIPQDGEFDSDIWVRSSYYPAVERVLKERFGDVDVLIFDHTTANHFERGGAHPNSHGNRVYVHTPVYSALDGANRVRLHTSEEAARLLKQRCQIINVWRPLFGPLENSPLTFCDYKTVDIDRDYLAADLIFPHYIGEQYLVKHHPNHRWHFLSNQRPEEFTLMKCWDNKPDVARCAATIAHYLQCADQKSHVGVTHTSFSNPNASRNARLRESIEVRCLVFHK